MAAGWWGVDNTDLVTPNGDCGDDDNGTTIENALAGTNVWKHTANETHYFIIDLGMSLHVEQVRGRSGGDLSRDPTNVNIYVSDSKVVWGDAVAIGITTWQDTTAWQEISVTHKNGRYVIVEITATEDANKSLEFGGPSTGYYKIFDVYVTGIY